MVVGHPEEEGSSEWRMGQGVGKKFCLSLNILKEWFLRVNVFSALSVVGIR